ncbi:MAG: SH3 domain-containing protein [Chloroflexota bacterium]
MSFKLVYYSQQDAQWKNEILGFGDPGDTIGYVGCALTSVAMLLSGHGYTETPKSLNKKLKNAGGFSGALIRFEWASKLYPQVTVKSNISCLNTAAPLHLIDAALANGQPAIVMVDSSPVSGLQTHWVVLYKREGNDYLMLDPVPYQTDVTKQTYMMPRYAQGKSLERAIQHVILYEVFGSGGPIPVPDETETPHTPPLTDPVSGAVARARVKAEWGLNIRSSTDTSSDANIVARAPFGTELRIVESDGASKIGAINQWVRVRDSQGHEGFVAAWYLEKTAEAGTAPVTEPTTSPESEAPASASKPEPTKLLVIVKAAAKIYKQAGKGEVVSTEKKGARLVVVEAADQALAKIGAAGKWLNVKATNNKRGYVDGGTVRKG